MSVFEDLYGIDVNAKIEQKGKLKYLSWTYAWSELKKRCPDANYEIVMFDGRPYLYDENLGYMCMVNVTAGGETHSMWLPVMDGANNAMKSEPYEYTIKNPNFKYAKWDEEKKGYYDSYGNPQPEFITKNVDAASMFDVNKTIMRCLVKAIAMFGLGLYIYAGEDLPETPTLTDKVKQEALIARLKELKIPQKNLLAVLRIDSLEKMTLDNFVLVMDGLNNYEDRVKFFNDLCNRDNVPASEVLKVIKANDPSELTITGILQLMNDDTWAIIKAKAHDAMKKNGLSAKSE